MEQKGTVQLTLMLIFLNFVNNTAGFLWDKENIERLFRNDDEILQKMNQTLPIDQEECIADFQSFITGWKSEENWAKTSKYLNSDRVIQFPIDCFHFSPWFLGENAHRTRFREFF